MSSPHSNQLLQEPTLNPSTMPIALWSEVHASILDPIIHLHEDDPVILIHMSFVCKNWSSIIKDFCQTFHWRSQLQSSRPSSFFRFYSFTHLKVFLIPYPPSLLASGVPVHMFQCSSGDGLLFMTNSISTNFNCNVHAINPLTWAHFLLPPPSDLPSRIPSPNFNIMKVVIILSRHEPPSIAATTTENVTLHLQGTRTLLGLPSSLGGFLYKISSLTRVGSLQLLKTENF